MCVILWADSEGRLYWRRNLEHWLPEERLEKTSDQMENIHCAAPLHCPATGQGWALAVNNTHLTLLLSLSLFLPLAPFPHVPCGIVKLTPPSLVWNRRPCSLLGLAQSKKEAQFRLHSTACGLVGLFRCPLNLVFAIYVAFIGPPYPCVVYSSIAHPASFLNSCGRTGGEQEVQIYTHTQR